MSASQSTEREFTPRGIAEVGARLRQSGKVLIVEGNVGRIYRRQIYRDSLDCVVLEEKPK